jgi:hypothetical protein
VTERKSKFTERVFETIEKLRSANPNFEHAYDTYTQQYGKEVVSINEPVKISGTIDPVTFVLGRGCSIFYYDSTREIKGALGYVRLEDEMVYLVGRRQPQDSKLVAWTPDGGEVELAEYNHRAGIIPSRLHCAFIVEIGVVYFTDLTSSSGTVVVGESDGEPFVRIYDPSPAGRPMIRLDRISTSRKT